MLFEINIFTILFITIFIYDILLMIAHSSQSSLSLIILLSLFHYLNFVNNLDKNTIFIIQDQNKNK